MDFRRFVAIKYKYCIHRIIFVVVVVLNDNYLIAFSDQIILIDARKEANSVIIRGT
jgi:hypothetical protein